MHASISEYITQTHNTLRKAYLAHNNRQVIIYYY